MNVDLVEFPIIETNPPFHWRYRGLSSGETFYANWALGPDIEAFKKCLLNDFYMKYHTKTKKDYHRARPIIKLLTRSEEP